MKEERTGASISEDDCIIENGDSDSRDGNSLSIDTGEGEDPKPVLRINKDLQSESSLLKRKAPADTNNINGPPVRKVRPSNAENEADIQTLEKEIRALHWLARRKEQEWDQVVRLMKQKEEKLLQAQRTRTLISVEGQHLLSRSTSGPIIIPAQQQIILLPKPVQKVQTTVRAPAVTNHSPAAAAAVAAAAVAAPVVVETITEQKLTNLMQKANQNLEKASEGKSEKGKTPFCQGCKTKKSEFVCAGCSNRWYCSRECQVEDWDDHADDCSG